ncbi:hypothetical protein GCM10029964_096970 [Kibdelosporangium lantanae]
MILIVQRKEQGQFPERHLDRLMDAMQRFNDALEACAGNPVLSRLLEQARVFSPPNAGLAGSNGSRTTTPSAWPATPATAHSSARCARATRKAPNPS